MQLAEILASFKAPIPPRLISQKTLKGNTIDYVSWVDLSDLLDDLCNPEGWEWAIKDVQVVGDSLTLVGVLTIHGDDRSLTRMATGIEALDCSAYGDPSSNSEAMALRRCCAKFGLGRDLWRKDKAPSIQPKGTISREEWIRRKQQQA
jgi:hypothetical protein